MAYNTKKLLTDRDNNPIPQSYDSDGDRYVPSEIDTRLKAIERQQTEILERLDKPIDTQLTGSNVELIDVWKDFSCPSGINTTLDVVDVSDYKYLFIHYTPNGLEDYDIRVSLQRLDRDASLVREDIEKRTSRSNGSTDRFTVNSIKMSVVVYNKTDSDHDFGEIALGGVVG